MIVGLRESSSSRSAAEEDGLTVETPAEAVSQASYISVLVPDTVQATVYENDIEPNLEDGDTLQFAHGLNIHYDQIEPSANVDVTMVAPKSPRHLHDTPLARLEEGVAVPPLVCVVPTALVRRHRGPNRCNVARLRPAVVALVSFFEPVCFLNSCRRLEVNLE